MKRSRKLIYIGMLAVTASALAAAIINYYFVMPGKSFTGSMPPLSDDEQSLARDLERHVHNLATTIALSVLPHATRHA